MLGPEVGREGTIRLDINTSFRMARGMKVSFAIRWKLASTSMVACACQTRSLDCHFSICQL